MLLVLLLLLAPTQKHGVPMAHLPLQTVTVPNLAVPAPVQPCANWSWAAAVESILNAQKVSTASTLHQTFWIRKTYPGDVCDDRTIAPERLMRTVNGVYVLDALHKVRLESRFTPGAPTIPDDIIAPLRQSRPALLFWKGHAYVLYGVAYDEYIEPNGNRLFELRELKLLDPLLTGDKRLLSFVKGTDDASEIDGIFEVIAIPLNPMPWQR